MVLYRSFQFPDCHRLFFVDFILLKLLGDGAVKVVAVGICYYYYY